MSCRFFSRLLGTSALTAPTLVILSMASPAYAQCVSSGGTVAIPTNGATVTCATNGTSSAQIGDGTTNASVVLEAGHVLTRSGSADVVYLNNANVTLNDNAVIDTDSGHTVYTLQDATITLGNNTHITSSSSDELIYTFGDTVVTLGNNSSIGSTYLYADAIEAYGDLTMDLGTNSAITGSVYANGDTVVTLGFGSQFTSYSLPLWGTGDVVVTLGDNADVISTNGNYAIFAGTNNGALKTLNLTMGANSTVTATGRDTLSSDGNMIVTMGDGAIISAGTSSAVFAGWYGLAADATVTLGTNAEITAGTNYAIRATRNATVTLGAGALVQAGGNTAILNANNVTSAATSEIISLGGTAILGTGNADTLDIAGLVQGVGTSMNLGAGNDSLTLRTGSNMVGTVNGGANTDTLTLAGTGSENENFTNFEGLTVNATSWTLSGTSNFGTTNIDAGRFGNNGTITSNVFVNSGIFGGTGTTIGNITNSSTVAPGNSIGTQTITGNFTQGVAGILEIEFGPSSADRLNISGTANLDGTLSLVEFTPGVAAGTTYTFLATGGGITGSFSSIQLPLFYTANVNIGANNATVTFNPIEYATIAQSASEQAIASALDAAVLADPASVAEITAVISGLGSYEEASELLASQSELIQPASIISSMEIVQQSSAAAMSRVTPATGGSSQKVATLTVNGLGMNAGDEIDPDGGAYWIKVSGGKGSTDGDTNARGFDYSGSGVTVGAERNIDNNVTLGAFVGYGSTESSIDGLDDDGNTLSRQAGFYAGWNPGNWHLSATISGSWLSFENRRQTILGEAAGDFEGAAFHAVTEVSHDFHANHLVLSPLASVEAGSTYTESYEETGAGVLNMAVDDNTTNVITTEIGMKVGQTFEFGESSPFRITPSARVTWAHRFLDRSPEVVANFASASLTSFTSQGPERSRDSMRIGLDVEATIPKTENWQSYVQYDGDISSDARDHSLTLGLKYNW